MGARYICQIREGYMLVVKGKRVDFDYTGYPYPSTDKSNVEMLQDLIKEVTGIVIPKENLYNYYTTLEEFFSYPTSGGYYLSDFCNYLTRGNFNAEHLSVFSYGILMEYKGYSVIYERENYQVAIVTGFHNKYLSDNDSQFLIDKIIYRLNDYRQNTITFDRACLIELFKMFIDSTDIDTISNTMFTSGMISAALITFMKNYNISTLVSKCIDCVDDTLNHAYRHNLNISKEDFLRLYTALDYDTKHQKSIKDWDNPIEFFFLYIPLRLGRHLKSSEVRSVCRVLVEGVINDGLSDMIAVMIRGTEDIDSYAFSELCSIRRNNGRLIFRINLSTFNFDRVCYVKDFNKFKENLDDMIQLWDNRELRGYKPLIPEIIGHTLTWDLDSFIASDSLYLLPLITTIGGSIPLDEIKNLSDVDFRTLFYEVGGESSDLRNLIFKKEFIVTFDSLLESFASYNEDTYYNQTANFSSSLDFSHTGEYNYIHYMQYIPQDIINSLGNFNLFARIFLACRDLFIGNYKIAIVSGTVSCSYDFRLYNSSVYIPLAITKDVFNNYVKGACIIDFLLQIILAKFHGKNEFIDLPPLSVNNVTISFNEQEQQVSLSYI